MLRTQLLALGAFMSLAMVACSNAPDLSSPTLGHGIINGEAVQSTEAISKSIIKLSGQGKCTAVLIKKNFVLTAAHCPMAGAGAVGSIVELPMVQGTCAQAEVAEVIYDPAALFSRNSRGGELRRPDLAILKLKTDLCGEPAVLSARPVATGSVATTAGFGTGTRSRIVADRIDIKFVDFTLETLVEIYGSQVTSDEDRADLQETVTEFAPYTRLAVPVIEGQSFCSGDSGGPVYVEENGQARVVSINSMVGGVEGRGAEACRNGYLHFLTPIHPNLSWIRNTIK